MCWNFYRIALVGFQVWWASDDWIFEPLKRNSVLLQIYLRFCATSSDRNIIYFRWKNPFSAEANILSKHSPLFKYNLSSSCTLSVLKMRRCCDGRCWLSFADGSGWLDDILKTFCSHSLWNTWTFLDTLLSSLSFPEGCGSRTQVFHLPNEHIIILPSHFCDNSVN